MRRLRLLMVLLLSKSVVENEIEIMRVVVGRRDLTSLFDRPS
jgi:hypothetical protein